MPTEDVKKGECGCGLCEHLGSRGWISHHGSVGDSMRGEVAYCPHCRWKLNPDGFARRMVDWTVEEARPAIEQIVALLLLRPLAVPGAWSEEINAQLADELKRLLPEEGSE